MATAINNTIANIFFMVLGFFMFRLQKYSISQNEIQLVKAFRGLVYHVAKIQKIKRLDFNLLQNRNSTVVYGVVYVETVYTPSL